MLRRPPYPERLETRKEIEKHINELLDMDVIRKIGHNEIVEITTPVLITWHDGKSSSLYKLCSKDVVFEVNKERRDAYERIKHELTNAPVLILPGFELTFKLYTDAACTQGLGATLHQRQIVDGEPREGVICYIPRKLKDSEARYGTTQTEFLCLVWALEKLHYYLDGEAFEFYTDCTSLKSLLNIKTTNRHMLRWQIAIQEYRGNMTIIHKEGKPHTNADGLRRGPLDNVKSNPDYDSEVAAKIPIHFIEIDKRKTSDFLNGNQEVVPQTVKTLNQKEQKLPYWGYAPQNYTMSSSLQ
ncbi:hypothetical protein O181_039191 [Austropuccinia psidii MF-1]|uniref:Reverse transcriptase RNase H-like domain-containing protein n=1 Tax=Austropuccinia psidii MF-1 TaxID=1389203 RepID=A0A9Q3DFF9_9BASI|nr:hypothetical protein [Austropuccinia psidii MF-1]